MERQSRLFGSQPNKRNMTLRELLNDNRPGPSTRSSNSTHPSLIKPVILQAGEYTTRSNNNNPWYTNAYASYTRSTFRTIPEHSTSSHTDSGSRKRDRFGNTLADNYLDHEGKNNEFDDYNVGFPSYGERSEILAKRPLIRPKRKSTTTCTITSATATAPAVAVPKVDLITTSFADKESAVGTRVSSDAAGPMPPDHIPFMEHFPE